jgi:hypothetical protein
LAVKVRESEGDFIRRFQQKGREDPFKLCGSVSFQVSRYTRVKRAR